MCQFKSGFPHQHREQRLRISAKVRRRVQFSGLALVHHQNLVGVHDRVDSMRDRQHRAILKVLADHFLNALIGVLVDRRGRLVQD